MERAKLGRFLVERLTTTPADELTAPERLRLCFEELGPTFVKLGQVLATRPDLIPVSFGEEFKKLHDQVPSADFAIIERVLRDHFDRDLKDVFASFDPVPLGAASIAQVYKAVLKTGERVVVKVQRPGIEEVISEDLSVLFRLAELMERYLPETRVYNPVAIVEEFRRHLELETNFIVEANNIRRFSENFADEADIRIPQLFGEYTGRRVLVMEELLGIPLSHKNALEQEGIDPEVVLRRGLRAYLKMVFTDGLFHGDLHAGNMFVMPDNKIGLIDFGVVGRLKGSTQSGIALLLMALYEEDYERFADTYADLAPYNDRVDTDAFARDLRDLIAPYFGLSLRHVNVGKLLMDSTSVAAAHGLALPPELILFFKSIVTIEGMARILMKDFDFLAVSLEFAREIVVVQQEPKKIVEEIAHASREVKALLGPLPRQLRRIVRRLDHPSYALRTESVGQEAFRSTFQKAYEKLAVAIFAAALVIGASILATLALPGIHVWGLPLISILGWMIGFGLFVYSVFRG